MSMRTTKGRRQVLSGRRCLYWRWCFSLETCFSIFS